MADAMRGALFLGVDGGATGTRAVVVDATGAVRGRGTAGSANQSAVGLEGAVGSVREAARAAMAAAGGEAAARAAWVGLAGVDRPDDHARMLPRLAPLAGAVRLTNDAALGLTALPGGVGVTLIAGTGSIALGQNARGETARAGGWGWLIGDEGSGFALGRDALTAAARAADGRGPHTALLPALLAHLGLATPGDLIGWTYGERDNARVARLSALVFEMARGGDATAQALIADGAAELARAAVTVADALGFAAHLPLALTGGLLLHEPDYRAAVRGGIARQRQVGPVALVEDAALCAARAAILLPVGPDATPDATVRA